MSIIGHKGIQVLSDIDSVDDLPEIADVESEAVWYIESGFLAPDYIAPSFWDGQQFNEWISLFDGEVLDDIPDRQVSRPQDDGSNDDDTRLVGVRIETTDEWPSIGGIISANVSGATQAKIYRVSDGSLMGDADISGLSAGDAFTVDDVNLQPDTEYNFLIDNGGDEYTAGFLSVSETDTPYVSDDGNLAIIDGAEGETGRNDGLLNIVTVGDVGFD